MRNTYLQIICKGIDKFLLKTFLKKIISLFLLVRAFINSYFLPVENDEHEFINKEKLKGSISILRLEKGVLLLTASSLARVKLDNFCKNTLEFPSVEKKRLIPDIADKKLR